MRYNCEFKNCTCCSYTSNKKKICKCKHGKIWHNRNVPPTDSYLSFVSPRKTASKPRYVYGIAVFTPIAIPIVEAIINYELFCPEVVALPV